MIVIALSLCIAGYLFLSFLNEERVVYINDGKVYSDKDFVHPIGTVEEKNGVTALTIKEEVFYAELQEENDKKWVSL